MLTAYRKYPILRPLLAFVIGLYTYNYGNHISVIFLSIVFLLSLIVVWALNFAKTAQRLRWRHLSGFCIFLLFLIIGLFRGYSVDIKKQQNWIGNLPDTSYTCLSIVKESPTKKTKSYQTVVSAIALQQQNEWKPCHGYILIRLDTSLQKQAEIKKGDTLLARLKLKHLEGSLMPKPIQQYYQHQQIYQQSYIGPYQLQKILPSSNATLGVHLSRLRYFLLQQIARYIKGKNETGLAQALLLGDKDTFSKEIENEYRTIGIVHIIAISGMHLILIHAFFHTILKRLLKPHISSLMALLLCWIFSFLTGAGPSVIRACVMLSFIVLGNIAQQSANTTNSLLLSCSLLLLVQPAWLWNIGFWLSYAAVLSILLWQPLIGTLLSFENRSMQWIWNLLSVTISAQILTIPIILYCFGVFPLYFLFTNLFMIPLSTMILYGLLFLCALCWVPYLNTFIGTITSYLLWLMNAFTHRVAKYPFASLHFSISFLQMGILYVIIFLLYTMIYRRKDQKDWNRGFDSQYV